MYRVDDVASFESLRSDEDALADSCTTGAFDVDGPRRHIHVFRRENVPVTYDALTSAFTLLDAILSCAYLQHASSPEHASKKNIY